MICADLRRDLDPYLDGELDAASAAAIREHVGGCAACRRLAGDRGALASLLRGAPYYTAPDRLRARVAAAAIDRPARRWRGLAMAATIVVAIGGAALLVRSASRGASAEAVTGDVVNAHIRSLMANHLFDVQSTDQHTVKPWFLGKIDFAPPVVDLAAAGFPLVGGRLDYVNGRPAAALVYQRQQHTINVFIWRASDDAGVREQATTLRGFHVRRWTTGGLSFSAVSDLNDAELAAFVGALQSS